MILVTGGLGFIGLHTARSLLDNSDEQLVLTQFRVARSPEFIRDEIGKRVFVEPLDVTDRAAFVAIGEKYEITSIVHLVPGMLHLGPVEEQRLAIGGLWNAMDAADAWDVGRFSIASSIATYSGMTEIPLREDMRLPVRGTNFVEMHKKSFEVLGSYYAMRTGRDVVFLRIAGIFGPLYHSMANLPSRLVHTAVRGGTPEMTASLAAAYEEDGGDICYVKDCGRGIALLHLAEHLNHTVYNVASGRATKNREVADAVRRVAPGAELLLTPGVNPARAGELTYLDITRIRDDVGYEPAYGLDAAIEDYVGWLRSGNDQ